MNNELVRQQMVNQQVRTWEVYDPTILNVMRTLRREQFVPATHAKLAYAETRIPLAHGQKMMAPTLEGRLLQSLLIKHDEDILEIGTGSGYLTGCLALLAASVTSIEFYEDLAESARANLDSAGIGNVTVECGNAMAGLPAGQYDAIAVTGSIPRPYDQLLAPLKPGGRLFVVVGNAPVMSAQLVTRGDGNAWQASNLFETELAPLVGIEQEAVFSF